MTCYLYIVELIFVVLIQNILWKFKFSKFGKRILALKSIYNIKSFDQDLSEKCC